MKNCVCVLMLMMSTLAHAQVWEDFSDGELGQNPSWDGETGLFKISSSSAVPGDMRPALQLDCDDAGTAGISLLQGMSASVQWELWIKLSFNTSASNFSRVYLSTVEVVPGGDGIFLQAGGPVDSIWLGRIDSTGMNRLFTIPGLFTGNPTNSMRIKIVRSSEGEWSFWGDPDGGHIMEHLGHTWLPDTLPGERFGLYCEFTSSNASKFYFDDIYCGPEIVDSTGPVLLQARVEDPYQVLLEFNEGVDEVSASKTNNYYLSGNVGYPYEAFRMLDPLFVMLFFNEGLVEGVDYQLDVENVKDMFGNAMDPAVVDLSWYIPRPFDIILNEVLADPSPTVLLPEYEYIELHNRTDRPFDLDGWSLLISNDQYDIINTGIDPLGYLLFMDDEALPEFKFCGPATGFHSFSISNSGAWIRLQDPSGQIICQTYYDPDKYEDTEKAQGGWSLELTDPFYPCNDEKAWKGSSDETGGTPGRENSSLFPGQELPSIQTICCLSDTSLLVQFSHIMNEESLSKPGNYSVDHGLDGPIYVEITEENSQDVILSFDDPFNTGTLYMLNTSDTLKDCSGNPLERKLSGDFSLSSPCEPFDVIFNEILFHPLSDGAEYIELYNRSGRTVHLDELSLAYVREVPPNLPDTGLYDIASSCKPLLPKEYIVLTKFPDKVKSQSWTEYEYALYRPPSFPTLNNEAGKILLLDLEGTVIDGLEYSEDMHYPLLNSFAGVSLERICIDIRCTGPGYWHSASSSSGFGTPGYVNSQYQPGIETENVLRIDPPVFSPDGDGKEDVIGISCTFNEPGLLISITIFSEDGRLVRKLVNTALAGRDNLFYWDGLTDGHYPAPGGIYVILLETVSMNGYSRKYKKAAVLL